MAVLALVGRSSLPLGANERAAQGQEVHAGDVLAAGTTYGTPVKIAGARRLGVAPADLAQVLRVRVGGQVERKTVIDRTRRRFARAVSSPIAGRVIHQRADGDLYVAPIVGRWMVRSTLDGEVARSDDACVTVVGSAWALQGVAAYGPDAVGDIGLAVDAPRDELHPSRIDVRLRDKILIGGARVTAESIARAHACGVAAVVAGAAPAAGLGVVYGDAATASGATTGPDAPTVLCLVGFGSAPLPREVFAPLVALGALAAVHTASARLFVFAPERTRATSPRARHRSRGQRWLGTRPMTSTTLSSGRRAFRARSRRMRWGPRGSGPVGNVLAFDAPRTGATSLSRWGESAGASGAPITRRALPRAVTGAVAPARGQDRGAPSGEARRRTATARAAPNDRWTARPHSARGLGLPGPVRTARLHGHPTARRLVLVWAALSAFRITIRLVLERRRQTRGTPNERPA